ncbi:Ig-like domain-containing protein [candidate division KSB1 bacterium]|nr:Ig-like domain-containing protein [candidate division KSB1 bacterium]
MKKNIQSLSFKIISIIALLVQSLFPDDMTPELVSQLKQIANSSQISEYKVQNLFEKSGFFSFTANDITQITRLLENNPSTTQLDEKLDNYFKASQQMQSSSNISVATPNNRPLSTREQVILQQITEDFQVNENEGEGYQYQPALAMDQNGNFIAVWQDYRDGQTDIYAQIFNSSGGREGANFKVNDDADGSGARQAYPAISLDSHGNFIIIWQDERNGQNNFDIYAQRYSNKGEKIGDNFLINDDMSETEQYTPAIAVQSLGDFVIVWADKRNGNGDIYAQRYDYNAAKIGTNFKVNEGEGKIEQSAPAISMDANGNFVIVWTDRQSGNPDIYGQRYDNNGNKQGTNFKISNDTNNKNQINPSIAMNPAGDFMVAWTDDRDGNDNVYAQRYVSIGTSDGGNFKINDDTGSTGQNDPSVSIGGNGNWVVVWQDGRSGTHLYGQRFNSNGTKLSGNFLIKDDTFNSGQGDPCVAQDNSGNFVVIWQDDRNSNGDIYGQRYRSSATALGNNIKINTDKGSERQLYPAIAVNDNGQFVLVWEDYRNGNSDIYGQLYDNQAKKQSINFKINKDTGSSTQRFPDVAIDNSGNFAVVWDDNRDGNYNIYGQLFNNSGLTVGTNFKINDDAGNAAQLLPSIAMDINGNFTVVWQDNRLGNFDIYAQQYSSTGTKQGTNFKVNDGSGTTEEKFACISMNAVGNFVIVWSDGRNGRVDTYFQRYTANGAKQGVNIKANDNIGSYYNMPSVAMDPDGNFVVTWVAWIDNIHADICLQRYNSSGTRLGNNFVANDDKSGMNQINPAVAMDQDGNFVVNWEDYRTAWKDPDIYAQLYQSSGNPVGINYRVNKDIGYNLQGFPHVKFSKGHIYHAWVDSRVAGQGYDIFARIDLSNSAPYSPSLTLPANNSFIFDNTPTLNFLIPKDDENDKLHFKVEISNSDNFSNQISGSPFESKLNSTGFSPTPPVNPGTGNMSYTVQSPLIDGTYYWRVSATDDYSYGQASATFSYILDSTPPNVSSQNPAANATDVPVNTSISFHLLDSGSGVEKTTISLKINNVTVAPTISGTTADYTVMYTPAQNFNSGQTIPVIIDAMDIAGNKMNSLSYSFTTATQSNSAPAAPTLSAPLDNVFLNSNKPELTWSVPMDQNLDMLHFKVELDNDHNWNQISQTIESNSNLTGFSPTPPVAQGTGSMKYIVQTALTEGEWWWRVAAWDSKVYGNYSAERKLTIDLTPPFAQNHQPAKDAKEVAVNTDIILELMDVLSGVDRDKIQLSVNGTAVTPTLVDITSGVRVSYNPSQDFGNNQTISITINAYDNAGNAMTSESYSFTTAAETNIAPQAPTLTSPATEGFLNNAKPQLSWSVPQDENLDALHFKVELDNDDNWDNISQVIESKTSTTGFVPAPPVAQGTGSVAYSVQSALTEGIWWWRVAAYDGKIYGNYSSKGKFTIDVTAPFTSNHLPSKASQGVAINTDISLEINDLTSGIDDATVELTVNGTKVTPTISTVTSGIKLSYNPPQDFGYEQTVSISVKASDRAGNAMTVENYTFTTGSQSNTAPAAPSLTSPAKDIYMNNQKPALTWSIPQDVNADALHFKIELDNDHNWSVISQTIESKTSTQGFSPTPPVAQNSGSVTYTTQTNLSEGEWWWRVAAWDGKVYGSYSEESRFGIDITPPTATGHSPAKNATNVPINSNVVVRLQDALSGVDSTKIVMKVNQLTVIPQITGSAANYTLTYIPTTNWAFQTTINVAIEAIDRAGNSMAIDTYSFTTESAISAFTINHTPVTTVDSGSVVLIKADFATNITPSSVKLYYHQGGEAKYDSISMTEESKNFYMAILPSNKIKERGVEYFIRAWDNLGRKATTPAGAPASKPNMIQVKMKNLPYPTTTPAGIYRLFSIPMVLNLGRVGDVLMDDLSDYDKTQWRLFRYQGTKYAEFSEGKLEDFAPGRGFWLITRDSKQLDVGSGLSTPTNANFIIDLQPGWNMIGNPFTFSVKWDQVLKSGNVEAPVTYKGQDNQPQGFEYNQTTISPWQGYVVRNLENSVTRIEIPPTEATAALAKATIANPKLDSDEWIIQLITTAGHLIDQDNYIGQLKDALDEWDASDFSEVPPFDQFVSLYFPHSQWSSYPGDYTGDFRKVYKNGGKWEFFIESNLEKTPTKLELGQISNLPANWNVTLVDENSHTQIDLKAQKSYTFTGNSRKFSILVMPANIQDDETNIPVASDFELYQNYPNPFNPTTQIRYWLSKPGFVKLEIYNLTGQQIITLTQGNEEAGVKLTEWDGLLPSGERAPSGIYWCRLTVNQEVRTRKMVLAK